MKKFAISILSCFVMLPAFAHHGQPHYSEPNHAINRYPYNHRHHHRDWVVPAVIVTGAIVASELSRQQRELERQEQIIRDHDRYNNIPPRPVVIERPIIVERPVIIENRPQPICTEWREVQESDGRVYKERICRSH